MAGPTLEILLWEPVSGDRARVLRDLIASVALSADADPLQVFTTRPLGGSYEGPSLPFLIDPNSLDNESTDPAGVEAAFGRIPRDSVFLSAEVGGSSSHRILAELGLAIAERLDGIIAFCGLLLPFQGLYDSRTWDEIQVAAAEYLAGLPGTVAVIPYEMAGGEIWGVHVGDVIFLRAWLGHPDFHLIK
ncbi:DUF6368 family protein [Inquilinus sp. NPDC058860]|uniref:DUF6368 family protein n=1 Tax=Inquilinus sp. NPDC058860 TaxID=3346652 RepID=UPI0036A9CC5E